MNKIEKLSIVLTLLVINSMAQADTGYQGLLLKPEKTIKSYQLINVDGQQVMFPKANDKHQLIFFGYTSCPDICPTTLHKVKQVIKNIKDKDDVEFYFVSIDSARDTPKYLKDFLNYFHPDIKGLSGSLRNIRRIEDEFGILTRKFQGKSALAYQLEHSVFMYLLNKQGKLMLMYPGSTTAKQIIKDLDVLSANKESMKLTNNNQ